MLRNHRRVRFAVCVGVMTAMAVTFAVPPVAQACNKKSIIRGIKKALAKTPPNIAKACRLINKFHKKFPGCVLPPIPGLPAPAACAAAGVPAAPVPPIGRGRGGGVAGGGPAGGSIVGIVFGFNSANSSNCFSYTVVPDPANPPGFTVVGGSGTMTIPLLSMATAPFSVDIAPGVPVGTCAFFDVIVKDKGNGLDVPGDFKRVKLVVLDKLVVTIDQTDFRVIDGAPSVARWRVRNLDTVPVAVPYGFSTVPDPGSIMENNAGVAFPVPDTYSMPRSAAGGGSLALGPAGSPTEEDIIEWFLEPGEHCDPAMIGCCAVEIPPGNAVSSECFVNVNTTPRCCPTSDRFLIMGTVDPNFAAFAELLVDHLAGTPIVLPTPAPEEDIVDAIAQDINLQSQINDQFNISAIPMFEELSIEHQAGILIELISMNPGVTILPLPDIDVNDQLNVTPDTILQRKMTLELDGHPWAVGVEMTNLTLSAVTPITVINAVPLSLPDTSSIQTFNGSGGPTLLLPGQSYTSTADFVITEQNLPPVLPVGFFAPITVDTGPILSGDPDFDVIVPLAFGPGPDVQMDVFIHVRANGFDGVGPTQVQIDPLTVQAIPTGPNTFQISYQAQVLNTVVGIQHEHIINAGVNIVPSLCPTLLGDLNADLEITARDIQIMTDAMIAGLSANDLPCADFNGDGIIDPTGDTPGFVAALLN